MHHIGNCEFDPIAEMAIREAGGVRALARYLEVPPTDVSKFRAPREKKGSAGNIPRRHHVKLLELAVTHGWDITAEDIVRGGRALVAAIA